MFVLVPSSLLGIDDQIRLPGILPGSDGLGLWLARTRIMTPVISVGSDGSSILRRR